MSHYRNLILKMATESGVASIHCATRSATVPISTPDIGHAYGGKLFEREFAIVRVMGFSKHSLQCVNCWLLIVLDYSVGTRLSLLQTCFDCQ